MALATFGATADLLGDRYFPTGYSAEVTDAATDAIEEVANELGMYVRAAKVEPEDITAGHAEAAYNWLQNAVLLGAAARFASRVGLADPDTIDQWREDYQGMVVALRSNANVILASVSTRKSRVRTSPCYR